LHWQKLRLKVPETGWIEWLKGVGKHELLHLPAKVVIYIDYKEEVILIVLKIRKLSTWLTVKGLTENRVG